MRQGRTDAIYIGAGEILVKALTQLRHASGDGHTIIIILLSLTWKPVAKAG